LHRADIRDKFVFVRMRWRVICASKKIGLCVL